MPASHRRLAAPILWDARVVPALGRAHPTGCPRRTRAWPRPSHGESASHRQSPAALPQVARGGGATPVAASDRGHGPANRYDPSVPRGSIPSALLIVACATACAPGRPSAPVSQLEAESSTPTAPYLHPPPAVHLESPGKEKEPPVDIHHLCARDAMAGLQLCQSLAPGDPSACAQVCLEDYRSSPPPPAPLAPKVLAPVPAPKPPDPFTLALGDCVRGVREGASAPACRFYRPLDSMGFGQTHCDAKCSELTAGYRASHVDAGP
jgi:hypothetical protein